MRAHGRHPNVVSLDIQPVVGVDADGVRFLAGDINHLAASELPAILADCPRPILVIEDGPHTFEGCLNALRFFDGYLQSGEFIIIEDGILRDLGLKSLDNGPNRGDCRVRRRPYRQVRRRSRLLRLLRAQRHLEYERVFATTMIGTSRERRRLTTSQ